MANAAPQLQEAFELIESGDLQSARQVLEEIRTDNLNNPDFWWVYTHAVEDEQEGLEALGRVRQLAPNYPGLSSLSGELGISSMQTVSTIGAPSTEDIEEYYDERPASTPDSAADGGSGVSPAFVMIATVVVVAVFIGLYFASTLLTGNQQDDTPTQQVAVVTDVSPEPLIPTLAASSADETADAAMAEATNLVNQVTEAPTIAVIQPPTDTPEPAVSDDPFAPLYNDLATFGVPENGITEGTTGTFGDTYIVPTCSSLGPVATQNILGIIDALADSASSFSPDIAGYAFEITDCTTDTVRLVLGLTSETVNGYWAGEITQTEMQQSLQRVN